MARAGCMLAHLLLASCRDSTDQHVIVERCVHHMRQQQARSETAVAVLLAFSLSLRVCHTCRMRVCIRGRNFAAAAAATIVCAAAQRVCTVGPPSATARVAKAMREPCFLPALKPLCDCRTPLCI